MYPGARQTSAGKNTDMQSKEEHALRTRKCKPHPLVPEAARNSTARAICMFEDLQGEAAQYNGNYAAYFTIKCNNAMDAAAFIVEMMTSTACRTSSLEAVVQDFTYWSTETFTTGVIIFGLGFQHRFAELSTMQTDIRVERSSYTLLPVIRRNNPSKTSTTDSDSDICEEEKKCYQIGRYVRGQSTYDDAY